MAENVIVEFTDTINALLDRYILNNTIVLDDQQHTTSIIYLKYVLFIYYYHILAVTTSLSEFKDISV